MSLDLDSLQNRFTQPTTIQHAFIASAGLALFVHIAFLAPALYFLSRANLNTVTLPVEAWLEKHSSLIIWLPGILSVVLFLGMCPAPHDDLLAISAIATGSFSHSSFAFSNWGLQPASPWFGFEKLVALAIRYLGNDLALRAIQATAVAITAISVTLAVMVRVRQRPDLVLQAVLLIGLALASMTLGRAINGRVEAFFFAWAIAAVWMPAGIWLAIGLAMTPLYWLAWIYAPAALLLKIPLRHRLMVGVAYALVAGGVWMTITHGRYPEMFALTSSWLSARKFSVMENIPLLQGVAGAPAALALLVAAMYLLISGKGLREDWPLAAVAVWFSLPDMVRYLPVIATLAAIWIMSATAREKRVQPSNTLVLVILIPLTVAFANSLPTGTMESLPKFDIPAKSVVLGPLESGLYATIRHNAGIKAAPSFELGATDAAIQRAAKNLQAGSFDCALLKTYSIDYVLEHQFRSFPPCLKLDQVQGVWRLWKTETFSKETVK